MRLEMMFDFLLMRISSRHHFTSVKFMALEGILSFSLLAKPS